ncbi:MAG: PTS system trehalose-specific EIIBC component [Propionicimonas sp.]|nr:PTS system trehalose-specific EIIBC component [Propionicimonas sp.]
MGKYTEDAQAIVAAVGGPDNITAATNCVTRLRFALADEGKVDKAALEEIDVVKGSFSAAGQFQVVIGPGTVEEVAADIQEQLGGVVATKEEVKAAAAAKMNPLQQFVKIFSDIFVPLLPALVTAGLLMGINNILTQPGIFGPESVVEMVPGTSGIAGMIITIANTAFVFLPVLIGWSAVKRFGGNPLLGIVLGCMLVHPDLLNAWGYGSAPEIPYWDIFGWQIPKIGYQGQVLPILVAAWVLVKIELWLKKRVHEGFQLLVVAPVALLVTGFLAFAIIGPITFTIGTWLAQGVTWLFYLVPAIGGFIYGLGYAPLVITGMHHTFLAVDLQLIATNGSTFLWPILALSNIAQGSVAIGCFFALRSEKQRSLAMTSGISAYLGITEPAMFGVNLRYKFPFLIAIACAAIGGSFIAYFGVVASSIGVGGIPGIFAIVPQYWGIFGIAMLFEIVVPMVVCFIYAKRQFGKEDAATELAEEDAALAAAVS